MKHEVIRHRHETRRREGIVRDKIHLTPNMIRIVFEGPDFADFVSLGHADHVKLFFAAEGGEEQRRDYTPRAFDREAQTLTIDFAVHEAGPATRWAVEAAPGDRLAIGGPRGSAVVSPTFDWWLLIGDETALPAIGRRIEELPADAKVTSIVAVTAAHEEQAFVTPADHQAIWVHRAAAQADDPAALLAAADALTLPQGDGYVWIAGEAGVARALRDHFTTDRGHPREWTKAGGYWLKGVADAHEKIQD